MEITSKDTQEDGYVKSVVTLKKEFNLSEKAKSEDDLYNYYLECDIKEFIKREDNLLIKLRNGEITAVEFWDLRDKLAGKNFV